MDYSSFQGLHDLLKDGIVEYIQGNGSSPNNSGNNTFFIHNGNISTEIHLACALHYFDYFHSQVRFHIECVYTILVNMWQLLKIFMGFSGQD